MYRARRSLLLSDFLFQLLATFSEIDYIFLTKGGIPFAFTVSPFVEAMHIPEALKNKEAYGFEHAFDEFVLGYKN